MNIVTGTAAGLSEIYRQVAGYRHKVFVENLGWDLHAPDGLEQDQFDRTDTVYVAVRDDDGEICGCARLLPTLHPYLLSEVFPQLLNGAPPPNSPDIWELSRFAAVDFNSPDQSPLRQMSSDVAIDLLQASLECAKGFGAKRLIAVTSLGTERLLRNAGFKAHRAGPPMRVDGHLIFACWIEVGE
ncbi:MAG: GNAT family N-acetyltransferase [Nitrosomonadales bacterium]|nr:GNAT family N-acetyltransferase [Nitrosomonadales bacterium]